MDDRLRALERAARLSPGDREAAAAYARALEQTGARATVPRGARRLEVCATRALTVAHQVPWDDGERLFVLDGTTLHTLDARTLEPMWSAASSGIAPGTVWGPYVVHVGAQRATLVVRDRLDGAQVASIAFPPRANLDGVLSTPERLIAVWDRLDDDRPDELFVVDVPDGAPAAGRVREWAPGRGVDGLFVAGDVLLQGHPRPSTIARDLATAEVRWEHQGMALRADAREAFLVSGASRAPRIHCVDVVTGLARWTHVVPVDTAMSHALGPDVLVVATRTRERAAGENVVVEALDRDTGSVRWSTKEGGFVFAVAVAQDVVYVAGVVPRALTISCLDARSGERVITHQVELGARDAAGPPFLGLSPVDGAVIVTLRDRAGTWLARVGEP